MTVLDQEAIRDVLPHRDPILMLETATINEEGQEVAATATPIQIPEVTPFSLRLNSWDTIENRVNAQQYVNGDEPGFSGHFPQPIGPILPGVQQLKLAAILSRYCLKSSDEDYSKKLRLEQIKGFNFTRMVVPGDVLKMNAEKADDWYETNASVDGQLAFKGRLQLASVETDEPTISLELLVEAMAQLVAVVGLSQPENRGKTPLFASIRSMHFVRDIPVGEELLLEAMPIKQIRTLGFAKVGARSLEDPDTYIANGEIAFAVQ